MLLHKQYVTPFAPTNALEKLVAAKGYERLITEDHLTAQLFSDVDAVGLDHNVPEMLHTFCRTADELVRRLEAMPHTTARRPLFALTRPLDLHIGNIASAMVPPGESYPGFYGPYAARVHRIDGCFGAFVDALKRLDLYDNSIIVLTADHGDSLGEGQRWGHGFTAFPEVLRIPLIVHVPARLRGQVSADLGRVSFSTDITPTLYSLLGEPPAVHAHAGARASLIGAPLIVSRTADLPSRRQASFLVASSYGPVYGIIDRNGRHLYLADGVESREYAYDLGADGLDVRTGVTDAERTRYRQSIRAQIAELAAWYRFTPEH
jgi:arylsulfatase A-like enzyme